MCGILGVFRTQDSSLPITIELIEKMRDMMSHRGPDDAAAYVSAQQEVGLAHRRLSIIDLSSNAVQPMSNEDESVWIVFNGEIYNHAEIRPLLEKAGRKFKTDHSDTEVILKGYEEWGEQVLDRLRGMFAFAIWDRKKGRLWLARDRMGVKPLYYTFHKGLFIFASEIKAILAYPGMKRKMNEEAFYDFLTFLVSPAPQTLFEGIFKLPAAHTLTIETNGKTKEHRYWNPFHSVKKIEDRSEKEWTDRILSSLRESIRYRMVSDVKFGVFLSGGIDSSTNTALMAEQMNRPVETFSIGFENAGAFNELHYARKIVDRYKTNHHEIIIKPKDLVDFLPKLVFHQDEPIVDPVCVPVYYVSKLAKDNGTTVCQVGEGADELFCGYPLWGLCLNAQPWVNMYQKIPRPLRMLAYGSINAMQRKPTRSMRALDVMRRASSGESIFWGGAEAYQETTKRRFLSRSFLRKMEGHTSYVPIRKIHEDFLKDAPPGADMLHWMSYLDLRLRLPELLLMRVDKMTMATAVEARVPFLDQEFVQLAMSIPQSMKYKNRTLKYLLKKSVEPLLPREIIHRRKQGFAVPVEAWFQKELKGWSDKKILDFVHRTDYFNEDVMRTYLKHCGTKMSWFLLNFVLWYETWIEEKQVFLPV
ncbi:MAG: Asparagine synthetase [glutamine-hydrolyzing] 1 [Elusimicrobia bacterium]|nr:Asparagine synthetase [glutamine-hydrolyzing] 1 [Elusimicrobiota bacterium]